MEKKVSTVHFHDWGMDFLKTSSKGQKLRKNNLNVRIQFFIKSLVKIKKKIKEKTQGPR